MEHNYSFYVGTAVMPSMDFLLSFLLAIILASLLIPKLGPFLSLVVSALLYGLLVGMGSEAIAFGATGLGRIFSALAIVVFAGALIAEYLRQTGAIARIVWDLLKITRKSLLVSGLAGYIISLPVMCSITAFMILEPVVSSLGRQTEGTAKRALFMTAACSVISFNLVYPSPVMVSLADSLRFQPFDLQPRAISISLLLFALAFIYMLRQPKGELQPSEISSPAVSWPVAWLPLLLPLVLILLGSMRSDKLLGNPSIALLLGALLCLLLAKDKMQEMIRVASRRSGVILLDLCGAGAFGYILAQSGLGKEVFELGQGLPILLLPFLVSSVLQLAQGSRVVTAIVASQVLQDYPLDGLTMALTISAGAFMFSYVSDPYFWLIKESTGASMREMVRGYTLPLSLMGLAAFGMAGALYYLK
jgi:GntP family gluconate:H+ symporter